MMTTSMIMILLMMMITPSPPQWPMDSGKIYDLRRLHSSKKTSRCFAFCILYLYHYFVVVFAPFQEDQKVFCILPKKRQNALSVIEVLKHPEIKKGLRKVYCYHKSS